MKRNSYKVRSIILLILLILGIFITEKDFVAITKLQLFLIIIYTFILFWIATISARMLFDFRYLYKMVKVRNTIYSILKPLIGKKYAKMASEKIVRGDLDLIKKLKLKKDIQQNILFHLDEISKYKKFYK